MKESTLKNLIHVQIDIEGAIDELDQIDEVVKNSDQNNQIYEAMEILENARAGVFEVMESLLERKTTAIEDIEVYEKLWGIKKK